MLHKLSLDTNTMAISYWQIYRNTCKYKYYEFDINCVTLSKSIARSMQLSCCMFKKVFLVSYWRDILKE